MGGAVKSFRAAAEAQARELLRAIDFAEGVIVSTIERECEALRAGRMLAAKALRLRLRDAAKLYLDVTRAARASIWTIEQLFPGTEAHLDECRAAFAALLRIELAVLASECAAAAGGGRASSAAKPPPTLVGRTRRPRRRPPMLRAS
jgi:hypothetical protein